MAPHSSTLAWKIPWMEEPGRLQSMGLRRVGHNWANSLSLFTFHFHALEKEMATRSSVLAWRIPGTGEPGGLPSMGSHRVGHDWSDLAAAAAACFKYIYISLVICNMINKEIKSPFLPTKQEETRDYFHMLYWVDLLYNIFKVFCISYLFKKTLST